MMTYYGRLAPSKSNSPFITYLVVPEVAEWAEETFGSMPEKTLDLFFIDLTEEQAILMLLKFPQ